LSICALLRGGMLGVVVGRLGDCIASNLEKDRLLVERLPLCLKKIKT
jgi:hypothetical protein